MKNTNKKTNEDNIKEAADSGLLCESELVNVAGGTDRSENCYFEPVSTFDFKRIDGHIWMQCKSFCGGRGFMCRCHGNAKQCVDKFHIMEKFAEAVYVPYPRGIFNHSDKRKFANDFNPT